MATSGPNLDEAKADVLDSVPEVRIAEQNELRELKSALEQLHLEESAFVSKSRKVWSIFLGFCILVSLMFEVALTILVGTATLDYSKYGGFLPVVAGGTFAQVVGLAAIVLKWLFGGKRPDEMLQSARISD